MNNVPMHKFSRTYEHLLQLDNSGTGLGQLADARLKRLIWGWHGSQTLFRRLIRPDMRVADVGFNFAQLSLPLSDLVGKLTLIDIVDTRFKYIRELTGSTDVSVELIKHRYSDGSLPGRRFDLIMCTCTVEYVEHELRKNFLRYLIENLEAGGMLFLDMRDPWRWRAMQEFMWFGNVALGWVFPYLNGEGILPKLSFKQWISEVNVWSRGFIKYHLSKSLRSLGMWGTVKPVADLTALDKVVRDLGMIPLKEPLIDEAHYSLARNLEGLFGSNTFLGNPFWIGIYRKP